MPTTTQPSTSWKQRPIGELATEIAKREPAVATALINAVEGVLGHIDNLDESLAFLYPALVRYDHFVAVAAVAHAETLDEQGDYDARPDSPPGLERTPDERSDPDDGDHPLAGVDDAPPQVGHPPPKTLGTEPWLALASGVHAQILCPDWTGIDIGDVAHSLSNLCRFNGHTSEFYSVAQHSVEVSRHVPPEHALWGLLHDAAEIIIGDIVRPIKCRTYLAASPWDNECLDEIGTVELWHLRHMAKRFGLEMPVPGAVKVADQRMLATECRDLMGDPEWGRAWGEPYPEHIHPMPPAMAGAVFLHRYHELAEQEG